MQIVRAAGRRGTEDITLMTQHSTSGRTVSRVVLFAILLLLCLAGASTLLADDDDDDGEDMFEAVPSQVVVKLAPGVTIDQINSAYGTTTLDRLVARRSIFLLADPPNTDIDALIRQMNRDRRIRYSEPNFYLEQPEIDRRSAWGWGGKESAPYEFQYARDLVNLDGAHALGRGAGVVVAVVDTGVQLDHPELAGSLSVAGLDLVDGDDVPYDDVNGIDDDGDGETDEGTGHGTHVAGIVRLVAPGATLMPIRALDSDGRGNAYAVAEAIHFAMESGADVINLSLGMAAESDVLRESVRAATLQGVLVVAAAGNLNSDVEQYPAADDCVVAVTSVGPEWVRSSFANFGSWVDLAAPGESVYSNFPVDGYAWWSGTSMATPFAAGLGALLLGNDPTLSAGAVADYMGVTATSLDSANPEYPGKIGAGLIDAQAALLALSTGHPSESLELIDDECSPVPPNGGGGDDDDDGDD